MSPLKRVTFGTEFAPVGLQRYKATKNNLDIISILSKDIVLSELHFIEGFGPVYCEGVGCPFCEKFGLPAQYIVLPIVVYHTKSVQEYGAPCQFSYLQVSNSVYSKDLMIKNQIHKDLTTKDLLVSCEDTKFQKNKYEVLANAKWRTDKVIEAEALRYLQSFNALIEPTLGRKLSDDKRLEILGPALNVVTPTPQPQLQAQPQVAQPQVAQVQPPAPKQATASAEVDFMADAPTKSKETESPIDVEDIFDNDDFITT